MAEPRPEIILSGEYISTITDWLEDLADNLEEEWEELDIMDEWYDELLTRW